MRLLCVCVCVVCACVYMHSVVLFALLTLRSHCAAGARQPGTSWIVLMGDKGLQALMLAVLVGMTQLIFFYGPPIRCGVCVP